MLKYGETFFRKSEGSIISASDHFIDFSNGYLIDHSILIYIDEFSAHYARNGCGSCRKIGHALETYSDHDLAVRLMTEDDRKQ